MDSEMCAAVSVLFVFYAIGYFVARFLNRR